MILRSRWCQETQYLGVGDAGVDELLPGHLAIAIPVHHLEDGPGPLRGV